LPEFVPSDFEVPLGLAHSEQDYAAWTSSMEPIAATPGPSVRYAPRALGVLPREVVDTADRWPAAE
jgi:hypothetical protein